VRAGRVRVLATTGAARSPLLPEVPTVAEAGVRDFAVQGWLGVLGPRGLMPSPRAGTVTTDVSNTVREYKAGKIEFKADDTGIVHAVVGKLSFEDGQLVDNVESLLKFIRSLKPASSKGVYVRSVTLSATMSPGVPIAAA
ncbi:MAG: tripartite tricarboxylate transporter substrate-binding protein, partial [Planctomycetaceae bacterium]